MSLRTTAAVALALTRPIFPCSYCADLVQKRLHHDVGHLLEAMRAGFNLVSQALRRRCCPSSMRGAHVVEIENTFLLSDALDSAARVIIRHCDVTVALADSARRCHAAHYGRDGSAAQAVPSAPFDPRRTQKPIADYSIWLRRKRIVVLARHGRRHD